MPPIAHLQRLDQLGCEEVHGVIRSMTLKARVEFPIGTTIPTNFDVLREVLDACPKYLQSPPSHVNPNLDDPAFAQQARVDDPDERFGHLVLTKRTPSIAGDDPAFWDVVLHYEHILDGPNQQIFNPQNGYLFGKGKTSVVDKTTNFYFPYGDRSRGRQPIVVAYTFPEWETGIAGIPFDPAYPRTIFQYGEVNLPYPQSNFSVMGWTELNGKTPQQVEDEFVPTTNEGPWLGRPALTWLCATCDWECIDYSRGRYRFTFEFQYNVDSWDPLVVFNDSRTGRPPAKVKEQEANWNDPTLPSGPGKPPVESYTTNPAVPFRAQLQPAAMWKVPALRRLDYDKKFGATFGGGVPPIIV